MGSMPVGLRLFFDVDVNIGNCDPHMDLPVVAAFAVFQLVEVHRVVIINGRPQELSQVPGIILNIGKRPFVDGIDFLDDGLWEPRRKAILLHRMPGDGFQVNVPFVFHGRLREIRFRA